MKSGNENNPNRETPVRGQTHYQHILLNEEQVPVIAGTAMKVVELVLDHLTYNWSPEQLHFQHPTLTMGQIHSALAYYWDHKTELDREMDRRLKLVSRLRRASPASSLTQRLKTRQ
jgi:uncharacterized protein (DUF433 family)